MTDLKKLVLEASQCLEVSGDRKVWAREAEMRELLAAGAEVFRDYRQIDGTHVIEVIFANILFIHAGKFKLVHSLIPNTS